MKIEKVKELIEAGDKIGVKVMGNYVEPYGEMVATFRDYEFRDFNRAALHLQMIERSENPATYLQLIG